MVKRGPCYGLEHQKEKRSMDYFAGLDVSVKDTSVCIVDDTGKIVREVKVASEPEALLGGSQEPCLPLQADWIGSWAAVAMANSVRWPETGLPVICVETRHMRAILKAQIN